MSCLSYWDCFTQQMTKNQLQTCLDLRLFQRFLVVQEGRVDPVVLYSVLRPRPADQVVPVGLPIQQVLESRTILWFPWDLHLLWGRCCRCNPVDLRGLWTQSLQLLRVILEVLDRLSVLVRLRNQSVQGYQRVPVCQLLRVVPWTHNIHTRQTHNDSHLQQTWHNN